MIEVTLKYRLQTIEQFLCVLFQVGYTVIYLFLYLLNEEINTGMSEKKNKSTLFSSWATLLSAVETDMDRMRLERAFCYFYSCAKRVTHSGTPLEISLTCSWTLLPPFGNEWPGKQGANYLMVRWPMKSGRAALEEKNFPVLYWINQKALRVQISSCLFFLITQRQGKLFAL